MSFIGHTPSVPATPEAPHSVAPRSRDHFPRFVHFVQSEIGVSLNHTKRQMIESRLRRRIDALGLVNLEGYLAHLFEEDALDRERAEIFNAVTTNKTDFFREPAHFTHLRDVALPKAIERRSQGIAPVKIWSAAASTGAEAWTAAFVLADYALDHGPFRWAIIGTDVNTEVLSTASKAIYPDEFLTPVPRVTRSRWLRGGSGQYDGQSRVVPQLRKRVRFHQMNLLDQEAQFPRDIDVIFLRNVLIYFSREDQKRAISRMVHHLATGGTLYLGHSESMGLGHPKLTQIAPSTFEKTG